jgi:hypothetical protein
MKKQKKPIILVLLLAILFGGVAFMNKPTSQGTDEQAADVKQEKQESVGKGVADEIKAAPKEPKQIGMPKLNVKTPEQKAAIGAGQNAGKFPGGRGGASDMPTIIKIKVQPMKPKPNESSTSTQWYTEESARNGAKN